MNDVATGAGAVPAPTTTPEYLADVQLVGQDGNGFHIVVRVRQGLRRAGAPTAYIDAFTTDATSGDYDHLLQVAMRYCRNGGM